jgi:hypothetical protein
LRDTSTRSPDDGTLIDACAAVVSLVRQGSCSPRIASEHNKADEPRIALH